MMDKRLIVLIGILAFCFSLNAQIFNAGIGGGLNISQVDGDGFSGYNKAGPAFSVFVNTWLSDSWKGQLEISYSSKGSSVKTTIENPRYYRIYLNYIEIPMTAGYLLPAGILVEGGVSFGYLIHSKEEDELGSIPGTLSFRKAEFAVLGGLGYLLTEKISVNARISYSIIPVRDHAGGGTYYLNRGQNNNVISFLLHYQF